VPPEAIHLIAVVSPFLFLPVAARLGRSPKQAWLLSVLPAALTAYFLYMFASIAADGARTIDFPWAPSLGLRLSFRFDGLGLLFAALIAGIGTLIVIYAAAYLDKRQDGGRFHVLLFAFMGSMLGVVLSDNLVALFVFWELTGFTSYLLIGFHHDRVGPRRAALQALLVTAVGGLALLAAAVMLLQAGGSASVSVLQSGGFDLRGNALYTPIALLLLLAAFTKSAQFPFHFWLPNAMQAPTPVSAYLHSATMVKAGVYLVARMMPLAGGTPLWTGTIVIVGALTMVGGAYRSIVETDLKRILAYSTISALGVMMLLLGIGTREAVLAGLAYLMAHALYKGALFLVAGAIEHATGSRDVREVGGLRHAMPKTALVAALAACSMAGLPLFFGFVAKEQLYESAARFAGAGVSPAILVGAAAAASALLGAAAFTAGVSPFTGRRKSPAQLHQPPAALWASPAILAALGLFAGVAPMLASRPLDLALRAVVPGAAPVALAAWHGFTPMFALSVATLIAAAVLFTFREAISRHAPRALQTERAYTAALWLLDGLSRASGPPLQSASLRSYVLTIVVAGMMLVGTAMGVGRVMPAPNRWTPAEFHEAALCVLIIAAGISAAFARTNMAAVLSLGTVGYGVSLIYVLFGAPDLAMTQFAVETLTVVIFVLVFYQLRGFGDLSPAWVKLRDAVIAAATGTVIAALVLFIGTSGTTSRLAGYFTDAAPRLAHGQNVVNVILVDFRGFDTMGEITVLVTVAVGVRALLRIGRERHP
jgi:multicomponent Na+:H+ antiporter subunit A